MEKSYYLAKMTWQEVESRLDECDIVLFPIGSTEQHGPALPLDNDHFVAGRFASMSADRLWDDIKVTVAPTIAYGYSPHHMEFKGTVTLQESTLANVIVDVCSSLAQHGFTKIVLVNGHGGNGTAISNALHILRDMGSAKVYHIDWWAMASDKIEEVATKPVFHGCDMETSVSWYLGQRVLEDRRVDEPGRDLVPGFIGADMADTGMRINTTWSMKEISDSGVVGYSTKATKEKGEQVAEVVVDRIVSFIREIAGQ
ncbi:MAG: creatininase family protein [Candidatus Thorarchaeota archaeon]|nr:MAG: creatininase family protein [Candidatus Thorarchaeota archaeon]